jgi:UDP-glucose 4-epimerase
MKILVTGGAGYIGSHTVNEFIKAGYKDITVIDDLSTGYIRNIPKSVKFIKGDFGDTEILKKAFEEKIDAIIHFAALKIAPESVEKPEKYYENNVSKSIKLLEYAVSNKVSNFIFSSSAAVYGDVEGCPITEGFEAKPTNPYGWSKLMFEQVLADSAVAHGINYVSLRYFNAGGADPEGKFGNNHSKGEDLISVLMRSAKNNSDFTIFGSDYETKDGTCVRDIIHVSDLARAHIFALEYLQKGGASEIINLGSEAGFSVKEIAEKTKEITASKFKIKYGPRRKGDIVTSIASSNRAKNILGWKTEDSDIDKIIRTAWNWEKELET